MRKLLIVALMSLLLIAATSKDTFNDVLFPDGTVGEIEASVKSGKNSWTQCMYYADDYLEFLGFYGEAVEADPVLDFCLDHYEDKALE